MTNLKIYQNHVSPSLNHTVSFPKNILFLSQKDFDIAQLDLDTNQIDELPHQLIITDQTNIPSFSKIGFDVKFLVNTYFYDFQPNF